MSHGPNRLLDAIDEVRVDWPAARFVLGGRGLPAQGVIRPEVHICGRVTEALEAVDAMVKRAGLN